MSRRGAPRGKPMPPLALILLAAFIAIPFVLYFVPNRWWYGGPPPRLVVEMLAPGVTADAPPTVGMRLEPSGFGTVTDAPRVLAERAPPGSMIGQTSGDTIAPDVARFLRGVPRERWENVPEKRITVCTLEGPPSYSGRIVLSDGCLRFRDEGSDRPAAHPYRRHGAVAGDQLVRARTNSDERLAAHHLAGRLRDSDRACDMGGTDAVA